MDLDHNGRLDLMEFHKAFEGQVKRDVLVQRELTNLFEELDDDSNGFLSLQEFMLGRCLLDFNLSGLCSFSPIGGRQAGNG